MTTAPKPGTTEAAVLAKVERVVGYLPIGTSDLLRVLTHPDVLPLTKSYIRELEAQEAHHETPMQQDDHHPGPADGDRCSSS